MWGTWKGSSYQSWWVELVLEERLRIETVNTKAWMGNARRPYGSNTALFLLSPALLSMRRVPAGSFCMLSVSFLTFIPTSIHSFMWVTAISLAAKDPTGKKIPRGLSLITQQALGAENRRVQTTCKWAICISKAITIAPYPYLIVCHGPSSEVWRGCEGGHGC